MTTVVRMTASFWKTLESEVHHYTPNESLMFILAKKVEAHQRTVYIAVDLIVPDQNEAHRTPHMAECEAGFLKVFWSALTHLNAQDTYHIIVVHSHPFDQGPTCLSRIDHDSLTADHPKIQQVCGPQTDLVHLVFNGPLTAFDGVAMGQDGLQPIDHLIVFSNPLTVLSRQAATKEATDPLYARATLIPEYDQSRVAPLRIGLVGLGGLGHLATTFIAMEGLGADEVLVLVDPDHIEESNRQRLHHACPDDLGRFKVELARDYVLTVRPEQRVHALSSTCFAPEAQQVLATCDLIIAGLDSELARYSCTALCSAFLIAHLDLASQIIVEEQEGVPSSVAGGHARLFVPELTPCALCAIGLDQDRLNAEKAQHRMTPEEHALLERTGYVENLSRFDLPEPSVYSLNHAVVALGLLFLEHYLFRGIEHQLLRFFANDLTIYPGRAQSIVHCPYCGQDSQMGSGQFFSLDAFLDAEKDCALLDSPDLDAMKKKGAALHAAVQR